jgi:Tfp pilus assembly protein PilN
VRAVNLLPRDTRKRGLKVSAPVATAVVSGVLVVTLLSTGFLLESAKVSRKQNALDAARAELALIPPPTATDTAQQRLSEQERARVNALQSAMDGRVAWDRVLRDVSLVLPQDIWLNHMTLSAPAADGVTPGGFNITGNAFSHEGVARLLSRLQVVPDLTAVSLDHSRVTAPGEHHAPIDFGIAAQVRPFGAGS